MREKPLLIKFHPARTARNMVNAQNQGRHTAMQAPFTANAIYADARQTACAGNRKNAKQQAKIYPVLKTLTAGSFHLPEATTALMDI